MTSSQPNIQATIVSPTALVGMSDANSADAFGNSSQIFSDCLLQEVWSKVRDGTNCFKYSVLKDSLPYKVIPPGGLRMVAQFNPLRGKLRRRPQETLGLKMPFNDKIFNFTKVDKDEVLLKLTIPNCVNNFYILINNSPIEFGSSLLVPDPELKLPQVITLESIIAAVSLALASSSTDLKFGFNSLGAAASVNHLHWHIYYQATKIPLQLIELPPEGLVTDWLVPFYVIQFTPDASGSEVVKGCQKVMSIAQKCLEDEIAHNLFITKSEGRMVRLFIIPRKQNLARVKDDMGLIAAFCEFSGFFICKTQADYDAIDEERIRNLFEECILSSDEITRLTG